jgi:hypothetical protein
VAVEGLTPDPEKPGRFVGGEEIGLGRGSLPKHELGGSLMMNCPAKPQLHNVMKLRFFGITGPRIRDTAAL